MFRHLRGGVGLGFGGFQNTEWLGLDDVRRWVGLGLHGVRGGVGFRFVEEVGRGAGLVRLPAGVLDRKSVV